MLRRLLFFFGAIALAFPQPAMACFVGGYTYLWPERPSESSADFETLRVRVLATSDRSDSGFDQLEIIEGSRTGEIVLIRPSARSFDTCAQKPQVDQTGYIVARFDSAGMIEALITEMWGNIFQDATPSTENASER